MAEREFASSPFPGMDPYLERYWLDVHSTFISLFRTALNATLPDNLVARAGERMEILPQDDEETPRTVAVPDVSITGEPSWSGKGSALAVADMVEAQPGVVIAAVMEPATERFLHIISADHEEVVTAIELISPSNKRTPGWQAFHDKRDAMLGAGANWVEIDLTHDGDWRRLMGLVTVVGKPDPTDTAYRISVRVPSRGHRAYLFPIRLQDRLPRFVVPLRPGDPRVEVELQPLLDEVYRTGRYARRIRYKEPLDPPLTGEDAAWAAELLGRPSQ